MQNKRKTFLMICAIALCLPLVACQQKTASSLKEEQERAVASNHPQQGPSKTNEGEASSVVDQYIQSLREAKSTEYSSGFYRKYIAGSISKPADQSRNEIVYREGKIQFDTLTLREIYATGKNDEEDPEKVKENELRIGKPFVVPSDYVVYSPGRGTVYLGEYSQDLFQKGPWKWKWKKATDYKEPEIGRSDVYLKLYEAYKDKFSMTEDNGYLYLKYKGDAKKNIPLFNELIQTMIESKLYSNENNDIQSIKLEIELVAKKEKSETKVEVTPSEARIVIYTKIKDSKKDQSITNEDHFEFGYRDFNKVKEIKPPHQLDMNAIQE